MMSRSDWSSQPPKGAGAEEDGAIHGGLGYEVPAEGDGVWVGSGVGDRGHLVADAVSPHRWHGGTVPWEGRCSEGCWWMWPRVPLSGIREV